MCFFCMEEHEIQTVVMKDTEEFKGMDVTFDAFYEYCDQSDELLEAEDMIKKNSLAMKDAYRKQVNLLTSEEIVAIRKKYKVSQKNFSDVLDWGRATITRYENHHVQGRVHDDVLRKIDSDPKWFLQMLDRAKDKISAKSYKRSYSAASDQFERASNQYLIDSIQAIYANFDDEKITGGVKLNLQKVVEVINYFASKVTYLHKVKLMKMLWYSDNLNYKRSDLSITGLVYSALGMGAVPEGSEQIVDLEGVNFEEVQYDHIDNTGYRFYPAEDFEIKTLTDKEIETLDTIIAEVGHLNTEEIVKKMHDEEAYKYTARNDVIPFIHAENLSIE